MPGFFRGVADRRVAWEAVQPARFGLNNRGRVARLGSARIAGAFHAALSRIAAGLYFAFQAVAGRGVIVCPCRDRSGRFRGV